MYNNSLKVEEIALAISEGTAVKTLKARYGSELDELGLDFSRNWSYANRGANLASLEAAVRRRESPLNDSTADLESILGVVQDMNVSNRVVNYESVRNGMDMLENNLEAYVSEPAEVVGRLPVLYSQVQKSGLPAKCQEQKSGLPVLHAKSCYDGLPALYKEPVELPIECVSPIDIEVLPDSAIELLPAREAEVIPFPERYRGPAVEPGEETAEQILALAGTKLAWRGASRRPRINSRGAIAAGICLAIALSPAIAFGEIGAVVRSTLSHAMTNLTSLSQFENDGSVSVPGEYFRLDSAEDKGSKWPWEDIDLRVEMHAMHMDHDVEMDPMYGKVPIPQKPDREITIDIPTGIDCSACPLPNFLLPGPRGYPICGGAEELAQYDRRIALEATVNANLGLDGEEIPDLTDHLVEVEENDDVQRWLDRVLPLDAA